MKVNEATKKIEVYEESNKGGALLGSKRMRDEEWSLEYANGVVTMGG